MVKLPHYYLSWIVAIWNDRVKIEDVLRRVKKERNVLHTMKRQKADWIGHIMSRNCFLQRVIKGKIEGRKDVETDVTNQGMTLG